MIGRGSKGEGRESASSDTRRRGIWRWEEIDLGDELRGKSFGVFLLEGGGG